MVPEIALIAAINLYIAWRYAVQPVGPDEGIWLLWGMTGARPYREYQDCKPPGIHAEMWLLAKLTRRNITWMKFIHHAVIGGLVVGAMAVTGSLGLGLLATAMLQSSRLFAFQSWMDAMSGALLLFGMTLPPMIGIWLIGMAVCYNVKMAVPGAVYMALTNAWVPLAIGAGTGFLTLTAWQIFFRAEFDDMIYSVFTIPARMKQYRKWQLWGDEQAIATMFVVLAVGICVATGSLPLPVGAAALAYAAFNAWGKVWRPNHSLALAIVALARPDPTLAGLLLLAEMVSAKMLTGNVWTSVYPAIAPYLLEAKYLGEKLKEKPGSLWVDSFFTQVYAYSQKPPTTGMVEQLEIRDVAWEMRTRRDAALRANPPDMVVIGEGAISWEPRGYKTRLQIGNFFLLE